MLGKIVVCTLYGDVMVIRANDKMKEDSQKLKWYNDTNNYSFEFKRNRNIQNVSLDYYWMRKHNK